MNAEHKTTGAPETPCHYCGEHVATGRIGSYKADVCPCCYQDHHGPDVDMQEEECRATKDRRTLTVYEAQDETTGRALGWKFEIVSRDARGAILTQIRSGGSHKTRGAALMDGLQVAQKMRIVDRLDGFEEIAAEAIANVIAQRMEQKELPANLNERQQVAFRTSEYNAAKLWAAAQSHILQMTQQMHIKSNVGQSIKHIVTLEYALTIDQNAAAQMLKGCAGIERHAPPLKIVGETQIGGPVTAEMQYFSTDRGEWTRLPLWVTVNFQVLQFAAAAYRAAHE